MTTSQRIRVMCVDDNQLLAEAMHRQIAIDPRFDWAGWVPHADQLAHQIERERPDIILLDIDMPGPDAFTVLQQVAAAHAACKTLMFSAYVRQEYVDRAVEAGAWGYISKNADLTEVLDAIARAAAGEFVMTDDVIREQARRM